MCLDRILFLLSAPIEKVVLLPLLCDIFKSEESTLLLSVSLASVKPPPVVPAFFLDL